MSESVMMEIISIVCSALLIVSQIILIRGQNGQIPGKRDLFHIFFVGISIFYLPNK